MAEGSRKVIQVVGKIERVNREATARGQNGRLRAVKGLMQLKMISEKSWQIWVSYTNDVDSARYDVRSIQKLRTTFVGEGKLTLELSKPTFNILMRDCNPAHLSCFVEQIQSILKSKNEAEAEVATVPETAIKSESKLNVKSVEDKRSDIRKTSAANKPSPSAVTKLLAMKAAEDGKKKMVGGIRIGEKRPLASLDMSKNEAASIRKSLKLSTTNMVISERADYPRSNFPTDLKRLTCHKLQLKRIDLRLQDLRGLKYISLPENQITSLKPFINMKSTLEHVNLSNNLIEAIEEDVFTSKAFANLKYLNLSGNQLRSLPHSVLELPELRELNVANNFLQVLPYNFHRLVSLATLKLNGNQLKSLPSPISLLRLTHADISANCLHQPNNLRRIRHNVQLKNTPTLFELAGSQLMTFLFNKSQRLKLPDTSEIPQLVLEYMKNSKYCRFCGKTVFRYSIVYEPGSSSFAQEFVRSSREYAACIIRCDKCSSRDFV